MPEHTSGDAKSPGNLKPASTPVKHDAKRQRVKQDIELDPWCDPEFPKTVTYKDVLQASAAVREVIPETPITLSKCCKGLKMDVYYKNEICHRTGSFEERGAWYCLSMLSPAQKQMGVITASMGNWALSLAYYGHKMGVPVTAVLPARVHAGIEERCMEYGACVVRHGDNFAEAKRQAFVLANVRGACYLNGYDHPHSIAAAGSIGLEIIEQLPQTDAIIVPIGGGALIAGIAVAAKHLKTRVLIYGVEPGKNCCFFKALENEQPYKTSARECWSGSLGVPTAGYNAFHTARSLIDKMILVDNDLVARGLLHLMEYERLVVQGAGAVSLSALLAMPSVVPELHGKTVVCLLTGGNINISIISQCLERAKAVEGRAVKIKVTLPSDGVKDQEEVLSVIERVGCNILRHHTERAWVEADIFTVYLDLVLETRDLQHACRLKRVMESMFPDRCEFLEQPYGPIPPCKCFPKTLYQIM